MKGLALFILAAAAAFLSGCLAPIRDNYSGVTMEVYDKHEWDAKSENKPAAKANAEIYEDAK